MPMPLRRISAELEESSAQASNHRSGNRERRPGDLKEKPRNRASYRRHGVGRVHRYLPAAAAAGTPIVTASGSVQTAFPLDKSRRFIVIFN